MPDDTEDEQVQVSKAELEALQQAKAKLEEVEPEYEKLKGKDMNFENLRKAKDAEGAKAEAKETVIETMRREQAEWREQEEDKLKAMREEQFAEKKEHFIKGLVGDNAKEREKLLLEMDQLKGEVNTEAQLQEKLSKAYTLINGSRPSPSAFSRTGVTGPLNPSDTGKQNFSKTTEGIEVLDKITRGKVDWTKIQDKGTSYFN